MCCIACEFAPPFHLHRRASSRIIHSPAHIVHEEFDRRATSELQGRQPPGLHQMFRETKWLLAANARFPLAGTSPARNASGTRPTSRHPGLFNDVFLPPSRRDFPDGHGKRPRVSRGPTDRAARTNWMRSRPKRAPPYFTSFSEQGYAHTSPLLALMPPMTEKTIVMIQMAKSPKIPIKMKIRIQQTME